VISRSNQCSNLTGKTALVTGASGGIGGAIARAFHQQGATVALSGSGETCSSGSPVSSNSAPCAAVQPRGQGRGRGAGAEVRGSHGQARYSGANAGITRDNLLVQLRDEDWDRSSPSLTATFRLARAAVRSMMRRRYGRIIGIGSVVGVTGNPGQGNYTATKAGMIGMINRSPPNTPDAV